MLCTKKACFWFVRQVSFTQPDSTCTQLILFSACLQSGCRSTSIWPGLCSSSGSTKTETQPSCSSARCLGKLAGPQTQSSRRQREARGSEGACPWVTPSHLGWRNSSISSALQGMRGEIRNMEPVFLLICCFLNLC